MSVTIKFRRGNSSEWTSNGSTVLASGEPGYELDTGRFKIGNGITSWNSLPYASIIPSGFLSGSGININTGTNGVTATISVSGLNSSYISDFNEAVDDRIGSGLFVAGTGINLNYNDASNSFTVSVTGLIANPSSNRILTSRDNTTTGIDAESNLTFDGTTLNITGDVSANYYLGNFDGPVVYDCRNNTASTINKGTPVYISGHYANGKVDIAPADASNSGKMPALGLLGSTLTAGQEGYVHLFGALSNIDTSAYSDPADVGKTLFVASGGGLTLTRPTGENILIQNIARIARISNTNGRLLVLGPARTNDVPNSISAYKLDIDNIRIDGDTISNINNNNLTISTTGNILLNSNSIFVNGSGVSLSGHTHTSSDITNFNSAVSGLVSGIYQPLLTNPVIGTGIINHVAYWDATNNIAADSGQLFWDSTNNRLGIGTNSPAYALDVFGNVEFGTNGNVRILETGGANSRIVFSGAGSIDCASYFSIRNNAGTVDYMRVDSVGVGIGTSSPSSKLHVVGNANISDTLTSTSGNFTTLQVMGSGIFASGIRVDNGLIYGPNNNAYLQINRGGVDRIELVSVNATLQGSTQVTINGNNIFANGTLAFPKVGGTTTSTATQRQTNIISFFNGAWNGSGALDINNAITSKISTTENMVSRIAVEMNNGDGTNNRTERFSLLNNGRLGLGTTSPNALLHAYSTVSGSSVLNIEGTNGSLFSVVDNLSGTLMSVNNNAGLPIFEVFSDDRVIAGRYNQNDLVVSSGGNIGMGTATPSGKLHIVGNANISGVLTATSGTITTLYTIPTYVSPSALSSNQGNWNPGAGDIIRMSATTGVSISGIVLGNEYIRVLINIGSTNNITLKHEATSATSGNRIITSTGGDHIIPPTGTTTILYDTVSNRWRVL